LFITIHAKYTDIPHAQGTGLFVVSLDWESTLKSSAAPSISVHRAAWFNGPVALSCVSCLQMTSTGIFMNWDAGIQSNGGRDYREELFPERGFERIYTRSLTEEQRVIRA
jgi:hypothetical protein